MDYDDDLILGLTYRSGCDLAADARDRESFGPNITGPDPVKLLARLFVQVDTELGTTDPTGQKREALEEGVRDAGENRRPRCDRKSKLLPLDLFHRCNNIEWQE
jgi:hypothetical protein